MAASTIMDDTNQTQRLTRRRALELAGASLLGTALASACIPTKTPGRKDPEPGEKKRRRAKKTKDKKEKTKTKSSKKAEKGTAEAAAKENTATKVAEKKADSTEKPKAEAAKTAVEKPSQKEPTETTAQKTTVSPDDKTAAVAAQKASPGTDGALAVRLEVGDGLKYSTTKIEVPAGSKVRLTIEHTGKLPKTAMGHNFVLLKKGVDMAAFANAAIGAATNEYIPESKKAQIIAHTSLVGGGESDTIEFDAPSAGTYTYICSFPGHYSLMNGKFVVT